MDRLIPISCGFLYVFARNLEEMEGLRRKPELYSAKRVRISLGVTADSQQRLPTSTIAAEIQNLDTRLSKLQDSDKRHLCPEST